MHLVAAISTAAVFGMSIVLVHGRLDASNFRVPHGLRQATKADIAARLAGAADKTHVAKRQTTSNLPSGPCGDAVNGRGIFGCIFQPYCSTLLQGSEPIQTTTQLSFSVCIAGCDTDPDCGSISSTQQCTFYNVNSTETIISHTDYESVIYDGC